MLLLFPLRLKFKENFPLCDNHLNSIKTSNLHFLKKGGFFFLSPKLSFLVYSNDEQSHQIPVSQHQVLELSMSISEQRQHHTNHRLSLQYSPN